MIIFSYKSGVALVVCIIRILLHFEDTYAPFLCGKRVAKVQVLLAKRSSYYTCIAWCHSDWENDCLTFWRSTWENKVFSQECPDLALANMG